jgi:hypothetical protein
MKHYWDSTDGRSKLVQTVVPHSKVTDTLAELHGGLSGHLGVNKTMDKVRNIYHWLQTRNNVDKWCRNRNTCTASRGPQTKSKDLMHQ